MLETHGPKVLDALQALYDMGTDVAENGKVRVAALNAFVTHVKGAPRPPKDDEQPPQDEGELLERVVETVCKRNPGLVAGKLLALQGGKATP